MANNDTYSFRVTETVVPSAAAVVSTGVSIEKQCTRMGLVITATLTDADPIDGDYTVIVETAVDGEPASGDWRENNLDSVTFDAVGTYPIQLAQPVIDKVRARIECSGSTPDAVTIKLHWLCDTTLTANS